MRRYGSTNLAGSSRVNKVTIKSLPKDVDPEQTIIGEDGYNRNGSFYPMATTFTIGVNLTF